MTNRKREVAAEYSTYYVCDVHGWDFTNVDDDVCPVCHGERLAEERAIKLLEELFNKAENAETRRLLTMGIALIKGENK